MDRRLNLRALIALGGVVAVVLLIFAGGYGYHRDELYFLAAGEHLAWGFPDQGPLTPLLAHATNAVAPGSLTVLRISSALMAGTTVFVTGLICFELGGSLRAQLIASSCAAAASIVLVTGHLLSTTTLDLLAWALVSWLIVRALRTGQGPLWAAAGVVSGVALLNKPLIAFLLLAIGAGLLAVGPRSALRSRWPWLGLLVALILWTPWLIWQAAHGWPQLEVSSSIANGGSASSQPRWALLPFQLLLVSPLLAPVWIAGLVALARDSRMRQFRFFAIAWLLLAVFFLASGGKPYYLAGTFPMLLAAGSTQTDRWLEGGTQARRLGAFWTAVVLSAVVSAVIALPLLPEKQLGPVLAVNGDVGETIGWPQLAHSVAVAFRRAGAGAVIFTSNYGEAGAVDRFGPALGLPAAYSGHNGFAEWRPPLDRSGPVVVVGLSGPELEAHFKGCRLVARIGNSADVSNDERGKSISVCAGTRGSWSRIWGSLRHLG